jgi:REP element-mobilizing transposase RayT
MVIAYNVIITAYGFWLPNDPRGSWSEFVRRWDLLRFGTATKVDERRSVAGRAVGREAWKRRDEAKDALLYPPVRFNRQQIAAISDGFADGVHRSGFRIYAAAILRDHSHVVIGRHHYPIEQVVNRLKGAATRELSGRNVHPLIAHRAPQGAAPSPWAQGLWKVFLNRPEDVIRSIQYARDNLIREGCPAQEWPFLTQYPV